MKQQQQRQRHRRHTTSTSTSTSTSTRRTRPTGRSQHQHNNHSKHQQQNLNQNHPPNPSSSSVPVPVPVEGTIIRKKQKRHHHRRRRHTNTDTAAHTDTAHTDTADTHPDTKAIEISRTMTDANNQKQSKKHECECEYECEGMTITPNDVNVSEDTVTVTENASSPLSTIVTPHTTHPNPNSNSNNTSGRDDRTDRTHNHRKRNQMQMQMRKENNDIHNDNDIHNHNGNDNHNPMMMMTMTRIKKYDSLVAPSEQFGRACRHELIELNNELELELNKNTLNVKSLQNDQQKQQKKRQQLQQQQRQQQQRQNVYTLSSTRVQHLLYECNLIDDNDNDNDKRNDNTDNNNTDNDNTDNDNSDPIVHWLEYIQYIKSTHKSNTKCKCDDVDVDANVDVELVLFRLYHRCVHALLHHPLYPNDERFLRICILHADRCDVYRYRYKGEGKGKGKGDKNGNGNGNGNGTCTSTSTSNSTSTLEQFNILHQCKIGIHTAMFWMCWAWSTEQRGHYDVTEQLYHIALSWGNGSGDGDGSGGGDGGGSGNDKTGKNRLRPYPVVVERWKRYLIRKGQRLRQRQKAGNANGNSNGKTNGKTNAKVSINANVHANVHATVHVSSQKRHNHEEGKRKQKQKQKPNIQMEREKKRRKNDDTTSENKSDRSSNGRSQSRSKHANVHANVNANTNRSTYRSTTAQHEIDAHADTGQVDTDTCTLAVRGAIDTGSVKGSGHEYEHVHEQHDDLNNNHHRNQQRNGYSRPRVHPQLSDISNTISSSSKANAISLPLMNITSNEIVVHKPKPKPKSTPKSKNHPSRSSTSTSTSTRLQQQHQKENISHIKYEKASEGTGAGTNNGASRSRSRRRQDLTRRDELGKEICFEMHRAAQMKVHGGAGAGAGVFHKKKKSYGTDFNLLHVHIENHEQRGDKESQQKKSNLNVHGGHHYLHQFRDDDNNDDEDDDDDTASIGDRSISTTTSISYDSLHEKDTVNALKLVSAREGRSTGAVHHHHYVDQPLPRALIRISKKGKGGSIKLNGIEYQVKNKLGSGSYGTVLLLSSLEEDENDQKETFALKVQKDTGSLAHEFMIMKKLKERLTASDSSGASRRLFDIQYPSPLSFHLFSNGGALQMTACSDTGINLLQVVNLHKRSVPEIICIHYTYRMLLHLEELHLRGKILHIDVKPDNWCIRCDPDIVSEVMLVDYGRAKDLDTISAENGGTSSSQRSLTGSVTAEDLECVAMRENREWCFDVDCYGLCVTAHTLLFGEYMHIEQQHKGNDGSMRGWKLRKPLKRYWQTPLWCLLFDSFINMEKSNVDVEVYSQTLQKIRVAFGAHFDGESRRNDLRLQLEKQNAMLPKCK